MRRCTYATGMLIIKHVLAGMVLALENLIIGVNASLIFSGINGTITQTMWCAIYSQRDCAGFICSR